MKLRTKVLLADAAANYFLITPLILLFWLGTYLCLDEFIFDRFSNRLHATLVSLALGLAIEFSLTYWQDAVGSVSQIGSSGLGSLVTTLYSRLYNYVLAVGNIAHYRAVQELYDMFIAPQKSPGLSEGQLAAESLSLAVQTAAASIVVLWAMRASRNITAAPFCLSVDTDWDSWFQASTLYQAEKHRTVEYLLDTWMTVGVVWSLGPLHWITLGYVYDLTIFPNNPMLAMLVSCLVGYGVVGICTIIQLSVKNWSASYDKDNRRFLKLFLEDVYIYIASAAVILTWKGVGMAVDPLVRQFPLEYGGKDYTSLAAHLVPFLLLSICYTSASLIGKGADMDGTQPDGSGVEFSINYFGHFFNDYITDKEKNEVKKKD